MNKHYDVSVVSIHDRTADGRLLAFDLKEILKVLEEYLAQWIWYVPALEAFGSENIEAACDAVEAAQGKGVWFSSTELLELAGDITQTVDGEFLAFSVDVDRQALGESDLNLAHFQQNKIALAILSVDSSYFEVYTKDPSVEAAIRQHFEDVRLENQEVCFSMD